jgi:uncharacterized protein (TIGR02265 family)
MERAPRGGPVVKQPPPPAAAFDPDTAVVFDHTVDGLLRALEGKRTARLEDRLKASGLDLHAPRKSTYGFHEWKKFVATSAEELFGRDPELTAHEKLGRLFVNSYFHTFIGKAVGALVRLLGPRRTLTRATQNFRSGNNFSETRLTELAPNTYEFWINAAENPGFTAGILIEGLTVSGAKDVRVELVRREDYACTFKISWAG